MLIGAAEKYSSEAWVQQREKPLPNTVFG